MKQLLAAALAAVVWVRPLAAQDVAVAGPTDGSSPTREVYHGRDGRLEVSVPAIAGEEVVVDGVLDEAVWGGAALLTGFSQYLPVDRLPAADSTEVLVMYGREAMYFGIRAFEPHGTVTATLADRDRLSANDQIQLMLDTFNDRRRAFVISANPLGIQSDGTYADGSGTDLSPDFIYESRGRITDYGYEIEIRLPFESIRYQRTDVQDWGIQVVRRVMHSGHEQTWTPAEQSSPSYLGQSGSLAALTGIRRGLVMDINPVMTARTTGLQRPDGWTYRNEDPELGGNLRWGVTPNISLSATVNPDFSQVEADAGQLIYDPRSAISFPEKRPFFLEANENFQVPNALIYTRRIVSPKAAAKVSGKVGDLNVGLLSAVDDRASAPGIDADPVYNVLRLRRDIGPQSNLGLVYTDRIQGDDYNRMLGFDTRLLLGSRYVFNGQIAGSFTRAAGSTSHWRPLFDFTLTQTGRQAGFNFVVEGRHPEFSAGSGFISRTGIAHANFTPRRTWFPESSVFESVTFTPILDGTWDWDRFTAGTEPNDIKVNSRISATLRGGWNATIFTWTESFKYPAYLYTNYYIERHDAAGAVTDTVPYVGTDRLTNLGMMLNVSTPSWRTFSASAEVLGGQDDNFDEWSSAWILYSTIEADWRPTGKVRVNGRFVEQRVYRKSDGSRVRLRTIPRIKLEYQLSRPIFIRFVGQYDGLEIDELRDDSRTGDPILIRTADGFRRAAAISRGGLRVDWLFSYQPNPGTVFFAGYGASLDGDDLFRPREFERTADGFFVKLSYLLRL